MVAFCHSGIFIQWPNFVQERSRTRSRPKRFPEHSSTPIHVLFNPRRAPTNYFLMAVPDFARHTMPAAGAMVRLAGRSRSLSLPLLSGK